jgi:hypothetical protein
MAGLFASWSPMALTDLSRAFADLSTHTKRLEEAKARKAELRLELDAVNAAIDAAENAVQTTQRLVKELAARLGQ